MLCWARVVDWGLTSMLVVCRLFVGVSTDPELRGVDWGLTSVLVV